MPAILIPIIELQEQDEASGGSGSSRNVVAALVSVLVALTLLIIIVILVIYIVRRKQMAVNYEKSQGICKFSFFDFKYVIEMLFSN